MVSYEGRLRHEVPVKYTTSTTRQHGIRSTLRPLLRRTNLMSNLMRLFSKRPTMLRHLLRARPTRQRVNKQISKGTRLQRVGRQSRDRPLHMGFHAFRLREGIHIPFFRATPSLTTANTLRRGEHMLRARLIHREGRIMPRRPRHLVTPYGSRVPFQQLFLLLCHANVTRYLLVRNRRLLYLKMGIPTYQNRSRPTQCVLRRFGLRLPFRHTSLLQGHQLQGVRYLYYYQGAIRLCSLRGSFRYALIRLHVLTFLC